MYRRQFILCNDLIPQLSDWNTSPLGKYHLYVHPDLKITTGQNNKHIITLLGDIFNPHYSNFDNSDIVCKIINTTESFDDILNSIYYCSGRYVLFYENKNQIIVLNDTLALREVYYCTSDNLILCASQPNLIQRYSQPFIKESTDPIKIDYNRHHRPLVREGRLWVGDETNFENINHLLPNHYLDLNNKQSIRYWPNKIISTIPTTDSAKQVSELLQGNIKAISNRYKLMMAVTAGNDSRSLLAASRKLVDKIYFFINKEKHLHDRSPDLVIPKDIFNRINIPFHIHEIDNNVDKEFNDIFLSNTYLSTNRIVSTIYNVYFRKHSDKVNLLGVGEIGREYYGKAPKNISGFYLARCLKYKNCSYAIAQCDKWLDDAKPFADKYNVDIMSMFLWEMLLGNWGAVGNSESDIAIEEFDPYDSHIIYEIMLSSSQKGHILFNEMYKQMWPELLDFPINPPVTFKENVKSMLKTFNFYFTIKKFEYLIERLYYKTN